MRRLMILTCIYIISNGAFGIQYVVDSELGDDSNSGIGTDSAFRTIQRCVEQLKGSEPGDECRIRSGRYHEVVEISGLKGTRDKPFIIGGYGDERPIWDGTVPIQPESWSFNEATGVCSASIQDDIFALLLNDDLLTPARWPNALWSDKTLFNNSYWGHCNANSSYGHIIDDGYAGLAESGIDATGSMAILNVGSWITYVRPVLSHNPGSPEFTYNHDMGHVPWNDKYNQYYLEAGLSLLDAPEEWVYDNSTKILYLIPKDGICPDPESTTLRGRTIDYGLIINDTSGLKISNITFLAANINAYSYPWHNSIPFAEIDELHLDSLVFKFPSSSHRMLGSTDQPLYTRLIAMAWNDGSKVRGHVSVVNCTFEGSDGTPLVHDGIGNFIHNNLFVYNVFTGQWYGGEAGGGGIILGRGEEEIISQNTLWYNGGSEGIRPSANCTVKFNHIIGHCAGKNQNDGAAIQVVRTYQNGAKLSNNWIHDSPKHGIRFDTPEPLGNATMGNGGYAGHNVIWDTEGMTIKGDDHTIENNLVIDKNEGDECSLCVIYRIWTDPTIFNNLTTTINNGASQADGGKNVDDWPNDWPLAGEVVENNYSGKDVRVQIVDPDNWDYRPVEGGVFTQGGDIIGPYLPGKEVKTYWIPGRKLFKTSTPIPVSGRSTSSDRDVVMFLGGYMADEHHFYFGMDELRIEEATMEDEEYQYTLDDDEGNILSLPKLEECSQYFWRVDVQQGGHIYKGDVWNFYT
ncbi:unnamed protein product [Meganyctiphanes norvegica]|uniref:Right handed beta helix domain-containing protein n=1 Tax=Meganyctiphanes norvegica TaxID=48144 RepID=A0AAV2RX44_MEGNR